MPSTLASLSGICSAQPCITHRRFSRHSASEGSEGSRVKEKSIERATESRLVWEGLEAFAREAVQHLLQQVLEEERDLRATDYSTTWIARDSAGHQRGVRPAG